MFRRCEPLQKLASVAGKPMPGVFEISQNLPIGIAIEEIVTIAACSRDEEWNDMIQFLPL